MHVDFSLCETSCMLTFLFVKLLYWFFSLWNWFFSWNFCVLSFCLGILLRVDCCSWKLLHVDFLSMKLLHWFFSSWNWFCAWNLFCTEFTPGTCCVLISIRGISGMLSLLFEKLVNWFFSSLDWFCSWNLLHVDFLFVELVAHWFVFVKLVTCLFLFLKLGACWFFFSGKLYIYFSPRKTDFANGTCYVLIFVCDTSCVLIFLFVKLVNWFSPRDTYFVIRITACWFLFSEVVAR